MQQASLCYVRHGVPVGLTCLTGVNQTCRLLAQASEDAFKSTCVSAGWMVPRRPRGEAAGMKHYPWRSLYWWVPRNKPSCDAMILMILMMIVIVKCDDHDHDCGGGGGGDADEMMMMMIFG